MDNNSTLLRYFSGSIYKALLAFEGDPCEIRMRNGKPLSVMVADKSAFLCEDGSLTSVPDNAVIVSAEDIRRSFEAVSRYSIHSVQGQISKGFITVGGGHRAGLSGTAVYSADGRLENMKYISSINFRVAHEIIGAADEISNKVMSAGPRSILICGEPCSGKTTILRDLCRQIGDRYPVSLIDERGEIAAESAGIPQNRVGAHTDVYSGFTKPDGILTAVRVMSPRMIFCDEIGSDEDLAALELAARSGVKAAATVHCGTAGQLIRRPKIYRLITSGVFEYCVFVRERRITEIYRSDELTVAERRKGDGK